MVAALDRMEKGTHRVSWAAYDGLTPALVVGLLSKCNLL